MGGGVVSEGVGGRVGVGVSSVGDGVGVEVSNGIGVRLGVEISGGAGEGAGAGGLTQAPSKTTQIVRVIKRVFVFIVVVIPESVMQLSTT